MSARSLESWGVVPLLARGCRAALSRGVCDRRPVITCLVVRSFLVDVSGGFGDILDQGERDAVSGLDRPVREDRGGDGSGGFRV